MKKTGFTLIGMSIVLIIIGLITGGILVGQNLIKAAAISAQISQISKYQQAVISFQTKYNGYLPGDIPNPYATNFGFVTNGCTGIQGQRDGNGLIEGWQGTAAVTLDQFLGENGLFWEDLSSAALIDGTFPSNGATARDCTHAYPQITLTAGLNYVGDFIPAGKIGYGTFLYVYPYNGINYYGLSKVNGTLAGTCFSMVSAPSMPVIAAYMIDTKIDDGLPTTGIVNVSYVTFNNGLGVPAITQSTNAGSASSSTCYDTTSNQYSIGQNGGNGPNCALSFQFQTQ